MNRKAILVDSKDSNKIPRNEERLDLETYDSRSDSTFTECLESISIFSTNNKADLVLLMPDNSMSSFGISQGDAIFWTRQFNLDFSNEINLYVISLSTGDLVIRSIEYDLEGELVFWDGYHSPMLLMDCEIVGKVLQIQGVKK